MTNNTMKAWRLHQFGLEHLTLDEVPIPTPGADEVLLVRVDAVSLNFRDKAIIDGNYNPDILKGGPLILVGDVAGDVVETGANVDRVQKKDCVTSHLFSQWIDGPAKKNESEFTLGGPLPGGLAEYMVLHKNSAVLSPSYLSPEEAATLPTAGLTAWFALANQGKRKRGDTILTQGTGGVSIFAVQLGAAMGLKVITTTSSNKKGEKVKELGAAHIVNYSETPAWDQAALELTAGDGVDQVLEVAGGNSINRSINATKVGGLITIIGFLDNHEATISLIPMLFRQSRLEAITVGHRKAFEAMNAFLDQHRIHPVIDCIYGFEEAHEAFRHLGKGAFGKVVIKIGASEPDK